MSSDDISIQSRLLMKELKILNVYQIKILQHLLFMFKVENNIIPSAFNQVFSLIDYLHPTRFSDNCFKICDFNSKLACLAIGFRGPAIWNKLLTESEKSYIGTDVFKNNIKEKNLKFSKRIFILLNSY